jgi:hypothetical protein
VQTAVKECSSPGTRQLNAKVILAEFDARASDQHVHVQLRGVCATCAAIECSPKIREDIEGASRFAMAETKVHAVSFETR